MHSTNRSTPPPEHRLGLAVRLSAPTDVRVNIPLDNCAGRNPILRLDKFDRFHTAMHELHSDGGFPSPA